MVDPVTSNLGLAQPTRGSDTGTWDVPVNGNTGILDLALGAVVNVSVTGGSSQITLTSSQYQAKTINFNGTLSANITVLFSTTFIKSYEIQNSATAGSSAFTVTLATPTGGGAAICAPPGEIVDILNNGTNIAFKNLGRIGSYWEYAGSSVPNWVSGCTIPPYLNCDGTAFSSAVYPTLALVLGGTTLPDARGRARFTLNQGTGRITTAAGGLDGNTNLATGGAATITLGASQIPTLSGTNTVTVQTGGQKAALYLTPQTVPVPSTGGDAAVFDASGAGNISFVSSFSGSNTITVNSTGSNGQPANNVPPGYVGGLTLIRAA